MQQELAELRRRNSELEGRLETLEQAEDTSIQPKRGKRGGPTVAKLQGEVRRLNGQIGILEQARRKDRKTIAKLRAREVKEDVAELQDDAEILVGDSPYRMRKFNRRERRMPYLHGHSGGQQMRESTLRTHILQDLHI